MHALLDAGLALVGESGLDGLTIAALAARMDWTKGAMYRYYSSKDELVAALNARVLEVWDAAAVEALEGVVGSRRRVEVLVETLIRLSREQPHAFGMVALTMADPRDLVESIEDAVHIPKMMALLGRVTADLHRGAADGVFTPGDPLQRALRLVFSLVGVLQLRKLARFDPAFAADALAASTASDLLDSWST